MRRLLILLLMFIPQLVMADMVFLRVLDVEGLQLVTASEIYTLGEECVIKNQKGDPVALSDIQLPATAKGDVKVVNETQVLNWLVVTDEKNNFVMPE